VSVASPSNFANAGQTDRYLVELVNDPAILQMEWNSLHASDPDSGLFLSFAWLSALYTKTGKSARLYTVRDGYGRLVCLFPAYKSRYKSSSSGRQKSTIRAAGRLSLSEYTGFVCAPNHEYDAIRALAFYLMQERWDRFSLRYEPTGRRAKIFADAFPSAQFRVSWPEYKINDGETDYLICPVVDLPSNFEDFLSQKLGRRSRKAMRSALRQQIDSGKLHVTHATPGRVKQDIQTLFEFWAKQWADTLTPSRIETLLDRHQRHFELAAKQDALLLSLIWRDDQPLAAQASVIDIDGSRLMCKMSGRDLSQEASVGKLLDLEQIKWAIDHGVKLYDFGRGNAAYKYKFGARDQAIKILSIRRR